MIERETFVIETLLPEAIGLDESGKYKIIELVRKYVEVLGLKFVRKPIAHPSQKFGLSVAGFLNEQAMVHGYAWDEDKFLSMDVSTREPLDKDVKKSLIEVTANYLRVKSDELAYKTSTAPDVPTWRELAPHILRQRLSIHGSLADKITTDQVRDYLKGLAPTLKMKRLSRPHIAKRQQSAWEHWETSGVIAAWGEDFFDTDIYTCKPFSVAEAIEFTAQKIGIKDITHKSF